MKKSSIESLQELQVVLGIGQTLIDEMKKKFPNMKIGEPYDGKFFPFIKEYVNTFIAKDLINESMEDIDKSDLWQEVAFIECFCKWLEEEKGVLPKEIDK